MMLSVLPLIRRHGDQAQRFGSAFFLSSWGLMASANHVIFDHGGDGGLAANNLDHEVFCLAPSNIDENGHLTWFCVPVWKTNTLQIIGNEVQAGDLAILQLDMGLFPTPFGAPKCFKVNLDRPEIGEECITLGYPGTQDTWRMSQTETSTEHAHFKLSCSVGSVEEIFPNGAGIARQPSFRTGAHVLSGMSGGPVIKADGTLIGVASSGSSPSQTAPYSYAALTAPLLLFSGWPDRHNPNVSKKLSELFENTELPVVANGQTISIVAAEDGLMSVTWQ